MAPNMDVLSASIVKLVVWSSKYYPFEVWQPGNRLKILLVGYNGKRNTGADVRVAAMVDQFYQILGKENIEIGVMTLDKKASEVYFQSPTRQIEFSSIYFLPLLKACSTYHIAVLAEGSCLKSQFANALTLFLIEAAGIMRRQGKPCIAYGSEAGRMDDFVKDLTEKTCKETFFIARNSQSLDIIKGMGLKGSLGTDTAWTFRPGTEEWAEKELRDKAGWDGRKPIIGAAVINPFCWPVKPSIAKLLVGHAKRHPKEHYEKYYFFSSSKESRQLFQKYLVAIAKSLNMFTEKHDTHPVIFGMEALDYEAATSLQKMLKVKAQIFSSIEYDGFQITALLRKLSMLVTSRYHARILSMPGGIPSIAISMDERLYNIFQDCGHLEDYYFEVDDPVLDEKLPLAMEKMWGDSEKVSKEIIKVVPNHLRIMAQMGATFYTFIKEEFPQFPMPQQPKHLLDYHAPLYPELRQIIDQTLPRVFE
jgi:polysaccharide pyruvyl transferase WcaK-like protein